MSFLNVLFKPNIDRLTRRKDVRGLVRVLESTQDAHLRRRVIIGLIAILSAEDADVREYAARALVQVGTMSEIVGHISPHNRQRNEYLVGILAELGKDDPDQLISLFREAQDKVTKWVMITSMGRIGDHRAIPPLLDSLQEQDWGIRLCAVKSLGAMRTDKVIGAIAARFRTEDNEQVRHTAAKVLTHFDDEIVVDAFINLLTDESSDIRELAAVTLGRLRAKRAASHLLHTLDDVNISVRNAAAEALRQLGTPAMIDTLVAAIRDGNWFKKWALGEVLGNIASPDAATPLAKLVSDEDEKIRVKAIRALIATDKAAIPILISMLEDDSAEKRAIAVKILGIIGDTAAVEALQKMERAETLEWLREEAKQALQRIRE